MITKYDINPTLGIYYDIESWSTKKVIQIIYLKPCMII